VLGFWKGVPNTYEYKEKIIQSDNFPIVCSYLFYRIFINSNGTCRMCCADWSRSHLIGDINDSHLDEIWQSKKLHAMRQIHLKGKSQSIPICNNCEMLQKYSNDNIDDHREQLLKKIDV